MMLLVHIRQNFAAAFFHRSAEWYAAGMLSTLGWVLLVNEGLMTPDKPGYKLMLQVADQITWGWLMIAFGIVRLTILLINGAWRRSPHARGVAALLTMIFWYQISVSFYPVFGYVFVFASGLLALDAVNLVHAFRNARLVDHAFEQGGHAGGRQ